MSTLLTIVCSVSLVGLLVIVVYRFITTEEKRIGHIILQVIVIAVCFGVLYTFFFTHKPPAGRGPRASATASG